MPKISHLIMERGRRVSTTAPRRHGPQSAVLWRGCRPGRLGPAPKAHRTRTGGSPPGRLRAAGFTALRSRDCDPAGRWTVPAPGARWPPPAGADRRRHPGAATGEHRGPRRRGARARRLALAAVRTSLAAVTLDECRRMATAALAATSAAAERPPRPPDPLLPALPSSPLPSNPLASNPLPSGPLVPPVTKSSYRHNQAGHGGGLGRQTEAIALGETRVTDGNRVDRAFGIARSVDLTCH